MREVKCESLQFPSSYCSLNDFNDNFSASITKTTTTITTTETRDLTNNFTATTTTLNPVSGLGVDDLLGGLHVDGTDDTTSTTDNLLGVIKEIQALDSKRDRKS